MAAVVVDPGPLARLSLRDDAGGVAGARESLDVGGDAGTFMGRPSTTPSTTRPPT